MCLYVCARMYVRTYVCADLLMQKWNCLSNKCSAVGYTKGYTDVTGEDNLAKAVSNKGPVR